MSQVREYETLYIITPGLAEDELKGLVEAVAALVKKSSGEIVKNDIWGKRKLSYPIKGKQEGIYVLLRYKSSAEAPANIDTYVKRTPDLLRHLTTVVTKQQVKEEARLRSLEAKRVEEARIAAEEAAKREAEREAKAAAELEAEKVAAEAKAAEAESAAEGETAAEAPAVAEATEELAVAEPTETPAVDEPTEVAQEVAQVEEAPEEEAPAEESKEAVNE